MKPAYAVIGANYGDEGKGRIVDYLSTENTAVIRFNGGAQAGHTVITPDGKRHVFQHVGAGAFQGARTYLAKHFVLNPILFFHEYPGLCKLAGYAPLVAADPRCYVTTPYDMLINQMVEDHRGDNRHGSCGVGFGETIERSDYPAFRLLRSDLGNKEKVRQTVLNIRDKWLPNRLRALGVAPYVRDHESWSDKWIGVYCETVAAFNEAVPAAGLEYVLRHNVVFEGAQGLLLDMDRGEFPHVTRSNTGLQNVLPIARALALELDVVYVTRTYLTRHGAGPIKNQITPNPPPEDPTNKAHPYQGTLRFGNLDPKGLEGRLNQDLSEAKRQVKSAVLAVTCNDQALLLKESFPKKYKVAYEGFGPRRDHLKCL